MKGYGDGTFCPESNITRAEVCIVVAQVFEITNADKENVFENEIKDK
ncbi:MAG: S-layer homology domain-containing protein [Clostridia bacterium]|nr:S-layer homology domain-containing protein [Clostridia bacterium]